MRVAKMDVNDQSKPATRAIRLAFHPPPPTTYGQGQLEGEPNMMYLTCRLLVLATKSRTSARRVFMKKMALSIRFAGLRRSVVRATRQRPCVEARECPPNAHTHTHHTRQ